MANAQKILITGTSSGFGRGAAEALAARGHTVFATMRGVGAKNAEAAAELRDRARKGGTALEVVELDVTDDGSVERAVAAILARSGTLDVVVHNAGVGSWGIQETFTPEQVRALFDVNVVGPLRVNRAILPAMRRARTGYLVYVTSGLGRIQIPFLGPYTASKHALEAIAETGSYETAPLGIETTILQPGAYGTEFLGNSLHPADPARAEDQPGVKAMFEAFGKGFEERARSGGLGDPQEVVGALVELIELPAGKRPLRRTVGRDVEQGVTAINQACAAVQDHLLRSFGMR